MVIVVRFRISYLFVITVSTYLRLAFMVDSDFSFNYSKLFIMNALNLFLLSLTSVPFQVGSLQTAFS